MSHLFGDQQLALTCAKCGHQFHETVARLETDPDIPCPECGVVTHYEASQFRSALTEADQALEDFVKSMGKFGQS